MFNPQMLFNYIILILLGCIGTILLTQSKTPKILTVDIEHVVKAVTIELSKENLSSSELESAVRDRFSLIDQYVTELAKKNNAVVIVDKAVLAGANDVTQQVVDKFKEVQ